MYLRRFRNNYPDHDFSLIHDTLKKYFPIDNSERLTPEAAASWPGFKKIGELLNSEFINQKSYRAKWGKLTTHLKKVFKKPVLGYPDLAGGGFFAEIILLDEKQPDFVRQKSLQFYVSIIGPFFSIHGIDRSTAILSMDWQGNDVMKGNFTATHAVTTSPSFEYRDAFNSLETELRAYFPGHRFVPYDIGMSTIKNLSVANDLQNPRSVDTIYEAIFGSRAVQDCLTRGDKRYGMEDWIKSLTKDEEALLDLISRNIASASDGVTVHKVWKLQQSKQLQSFALPVAFNLDFFDVIDFTDESNVILTSTPRGTPISYEYAINGDVITIEGSHYAFRIVELSQEGLTLNLVVSLPKEFGYVETEGEAAEIRLTQMKNPDGLRCY